MEFYFFLGKRLFFERYLWQLLCVKEPSQISCIYLVKTNENVHLFRVLLSGRFVKHEGKCAFGFALSNENFFPKEVLFHSK